MQHVLFNTIPTTTELAFIFLMLNMRSQDKGLLLLISCHFSKKYFSVLHFNFFFFLDLTITVFYLLLATLVEEFRINQLS